MITVDDAKNIVEQQFKGTKARAAYDYGDYYMIVAPHSDDDYSDPMYVVHKASGKYRFLNPLENIESFSKTMSHGPIKIYE